MELQIKTVPLDSVIMDAANARTHSDRNIDAITDSLAEFGQYQPIVVQKSTGRILAGNGRYEALRKMGAEEVNIVEVDVDNVTATRLALADNRTAELAGWDNDVLSRLLAEVAQDSPVPGWTMEEIKNMTEDIDLGEFFEDGKPDDEEEEFEEEEQEPQYSEEELQNASYECPNCHSVMYVICPECGEPVNMADLQAHFGIDDDSEETDETGELD